MDFILALDGDMKSGPWRNLCSGVGTWLQFIGYVSTKPEGICVFAAVPVTKNSSAIRELRHIANDIFISTLLDSLDAHATVLSSTKLALPLLLSLSGRAIAKKAK